MLSYLEKQKEQKPDIELIQRSWYMEGYTDGKFMREPMWNLVTGKGGPRYQKNEKYGQLIEQKPAEWREEDELKRDNLIGLVEEIKRQPLKRLEDWDGYINWLKSLRPQSHWKPSEEQMNALKEASASWMNEKMGNAKILESLYDDLKKL